MGTRVHVKFPPAPAEGWAVRSFSAFFGGGKKKKAVLYRGFAHAWDATVAVLPGYRHRFTG
ncbi:MAG: hypothetical protein CL583_06655 [Alteromonadaceae bacterium]|nr:hypothetical protein [Alteromonadaceae bacterium]